MPRTIRGLSGLRSCILPGLPTHLVQELKVGTVGPQWCEAAVQTFNICTSRTDFCQCLVVQTPCYDVKKVIQTDQSIGHMVVYYGRAAHAFSAGIEWRHCSSFYEIAWEVCQLVIAHVRWRFPYSSFILSLVLYKSYTTWKASFWEIHLRWLVNVTDGEQTFPQIMADFSLSVH